MTSQTSQCGHSRVLTKLKHIFHSIQIQIIISSASIQRYPPWITPVIVLNFDFWDYLKQENPLSCTCLALKLSILDYPWLLLTIPGYPPGLAHPPPQVFVAGHKICSRLDRALKYSGFARGQDFTLPCCLSFRLVLLGRKNICLGRKTICNGREGWIYTNSGLMFWCFEECISALTWFHEFYVVKTLTDKLVHICFMIEPLKPFCCWRRWQ